MKTANKILAGTGILIVLIITVFIIFMRIWLDKELAIKPDEFRGDITNIEYDFENFDIIEIEKISEVVITHDEYFTIELKGAEAAVKKAVLGMNDQKLVVDGNIRRWRSADCRLEITLPELMEINLQNTQDIQIDNFHQQNMNIESRGGCRITGWDNNIENMSIRSNGAVKLDFRDSEVTNADLDLTGASSVKIKMAGGNLTGAATGACKIIYYGNVEKEDIRTSGAVSIRKRG